MTVYIPTVKGRKTTGLCFRPKPAREQQVLVLKTVQLKWKIKRYKEGNLKCGKHSLYFVEIIVEDMGT